MPTALAALRRIACSVTFTPLRHVKKYSECRTLYSLCFSPFSRSTSKDLERLYCPRLDSSARQSPRHATHFRRLLSASIPARPLQGPSFAANGAQDSRSCLHEACSTPTPSSSPRVTFSRPGDTYALHTLLPVAPEQFPAHRYRISHSGPFGVTTAKLACICSNQLPFRTMNSVLLQYGLAS